MVLAIFALKAHHIDLPMRVEFNVRANSKPRISAGSAA
jgi:hypothetical protein